MKLRPLLCSTFSLGLAIAAGCSDSDGATGNGGGSAGEAATGGTNSVGGSGGTGAGPSTGGTGGSAAGPGSAGRGGVGGSSGMAGSPGVGGSSGTDASATGGSSGAAGTAGIGGAAGTGGMGGSVDGGVDAPVDAGPTVIDDQGGVAVAPGVRLTFPPGAVSSPITVVISEDPAPEPPPTGFIAASPVFQFEPSGTTFAVPVTVEIDVTSGTAIGARLAWSNAAGTGLEDRGGTGTGTTLTAKVNHFSVGYVVIAEEHHVAFQANASDLVTGDTNSTFDIFVHDPRIRRTVRVSKDASGTEGNGASFEPSISATGRYIAFSSDATNLVSGDTNGVRDIFVHDRDPLAGLEWDQSSGVITRVSVSDAGAQFLGASQAPSISADGRFIAFQTSDFSNDPTDNNFTGDIYVHDRDPDQNGDFDEGNGTTTRVSRTSTGGVGNDSSFQPEISADGRFVTFISDATNMVPNDTNGVSDIFVRDRDPDGNGVFDEGNGTTVAASVSSQGALGNGLSRAPTISGDGKFVAFESSATNLVNADTNGRQDVFRHELSTGTTVRVSQRPAGQTIFTGIAQTPALDGTGRCTAFAERSNLIGTDTNSMNDIYVWDELFVDRLFRASVTELGMQAENGFSNQPDIAPDCDGIVFSSSATNLVSDDNNAVADLFIRERTGGVTLRVNVATGGVQSSQGGASNPSVSARAQR